MSRRREDESDLSDITEDDVTVVREVGPAPTNRARLDRELAHRAVLLITANGEAARRFYLDERDHIIGRSAEVDISLLDESISRQHALLVFRREDFILKDLDSKNGTFLNGTSVHECPLRPGDVIQIGKHSLRFLLESPQSSI